MNAFLRFGGGGASSSSSGTLPPPPTLSGVVIPAPQSASIPGRNGNGNANANSISSIFPCSNANSISLLNKKVFLRASATRSELHLGGASWEDRMQGSPRNSPSFLWRSVSDGRRCDSLHDSELRTEVTVARLLAAVEEYVKAGINGGSWVRV